jgi:hypothetical protein
MPLSSFMQSPVAAFAYVVRQIYDSVVDFQTKASNLCCHEVAYSLPRLLMTVPTFYQSAADPHLGKIYEQLD